MEVWQSSSYKSIVLGQTYYGRYILFIHPQEVISLTPFLAIPYSPTSLINYIEVPGAEGGLLKATKKCQAASFAAWVRKQRKKEQKQHD